MRRPRSYFEKPVHPYHRRYEALRAHFLEGLSAVEVARRFGYSPHSFEVLASRFLRDDLPPFFRDPLRGRQDRPVRVPLREVVLELRRQNLSVLDISERLTSQGRKVSPQTVWVILRGAGVRRLPRRTADERESPKSIPLPMSDQRGFVLYPGLKVPCAAPLLLLFAPFLARTNLDAQVVRAGYRRNGTRMISAPSYLRAHLALKLLHKRRRKDVMPIAEDEGFGIFASLNVLPKKSVMHDFAWRMGPEPHRKLLESFVRSREKMGGYPTLSFNLDFHTIPHYGEMDVSRMEKNYRPQRSQSVPSVLCAFAQEIEGEEMVYAKANVLKEEKADEVGSFVEYWRRTTGKAPKEVVFDSQMTTHEGLNGLARQGITFLTLRERRPEEVERVQALPEKAWHRVKVNVPGRKWQHPTVLEEEVKLPEVDVALRQIVALDAGKEKPMFLLTNDRRRVPGTLLTRYAQRGRIENTIQDQVEFFSLDALSSSMRIKVDLDVVLDVIASACYRWFARQVRGWEKAKSRRVWTDLLDREGEVEVTEDEVVVRVRRFSHAPLLLESPVSRDPTLVPWLGSRRVRLEVV
jgi:transposase